MTSTSRDVARAAGVSVATVSRALSQNGSVSETTRRRVLAHAERLGYRPNPAARRLTTGRSGSLGVIIPDIANPFFADIVKGVQERARELKGSLLIVDTGEQQRLELDGVRELARQVDGIVWASPRTAPDELPDDIGVPVVLINQQLAGWGSVLTDYEPGIRQALENLRALGHLQVGYVAGPDRSWAGQMRHQALLEHIGRLGLELELLGPVDPTIEGGLVAADLAVASKVTALVAFNDVVACGVLRRLAARGIRVPHGLSVVGCDNTWLAQLTAPALTTIEVPRWDAGRAAVGQLHDRLREPGTEPEQVVLATSLVIRDSTAPPGARV